MRRWQKVVICTIASFFLIFFGLQWQGQRANQRGFTSFTHLPSLGTFRESYQRHFFNNESHHVTLLLHGHASSPSDFEPLLYLLEKNQISYYAPQLIGYGLDRTDLLSQLKIEDWTLQACQIYDLLTSMGKKVSVIGYSNGAVVAALLAKEREIEQLIFVSPNFFLRLFPSLPAFVTSPMVLQNVTYLTPIFSYDWIRKSSSFRFGYRSVPTYNIRQMLKGQSSLDLLNLKAEQIYLLYSKFDSMINGQKIATLHELHPNWKIEEYLFEGHNLFYGSTDANQRIIQILKENRN